MWVRFGSQPRHSAKIALADAATFERLLQVSRYLGIEREEQRAARLPVQAVHRVDGATQLFAESLQRDEAVLAPAAMHQVTARFVHANEPFVLEKNGQGRLVDTLIEERFRGIRVCFGLHPRHTRVRRERTHGPLAAHRFAEDFFQACAHVGTFQAAERACNGFERGQAEGLGLAAQPPFGWPIGGEGHSFGAFDPGDPASGAAGLSPATVRHDESHRSRVFGEEFGRERARPFARVEQHDPAALRVEEVQVDRGVLDTVEEELAVRKSRKREWPRSSRRENFPPVHHQDDARRESSCGISSHMQFSSCNRQRGQRTELLLRWPKLEPA